MKVQRYHAAHLAWSRPACPKFTIQILTFIGDLQAMSIAIASAQLKPFDRRFSGKTTIETWKLDELMHEHEIFSSVLANFPGGLSLFDRNLRLVLCTEN